MRDLDHIITFQCAGEEIYSQRLNSCRPKPVDLESTAFDQAPPPLRIINYKYLYKNLQVPHIYLFASK